MIDFMKAGRVGAITTITDTTQESVNTIPGVTQLLPYVTVTPVGEDRLPSMDEPGPINRTANSENVTYDNPNDGSGQFVEVTEGELTNVCPKIEASKINILWIPLTLGGTLMWWMFGGKKFIFKRR